MNKIYNYKEIGAMLTNCSSFQEIIDLCKVIDDCIKLGMNLNRSSVNCMAQFRIRQLLKNEL